MFALFNRFEIQMTLAEAQGASHQGQCDADVKLVTKPKIRRQLEKIDPAKIAAELKEYGAWGAEELADAEQNRHRIVWLAAGNIVEERALARR